MSGFLDTLSTSMDKVANIHQSWEQIKKGEEPSGTKVVYRDKQEDNEPKVDNAFMDPTFNVSWKGILATAVVILIGIKIL